MITTIPFFLFKKLNFWLINLLLYKKLIFIKLEKKKFTIYKFGVCYKLNTIFYLLSFSFVLYGVKFDLKIKLYIEKLICIVFKREI